MNGQTSPADRQVSPTKTEFTDSERLDWILRRHYEFRDLYYRFGNSASETRGRMREAIDREIAAEMHRNKTE